MPAPIQSLFEVVERLGLADLLHGQHVGRQPGDDAGEGIELGLVGRIVGGPAVNCGPEQVLEVPSTHNHDEPSAPLVEPIAGAAYGASGW